MTERSRFVHLNGGNVSEPALLVLEDGTRFPGRSIGYHGRTVGEVVFNTAMTGYQEILTDLSYSRQIVTLTYPHIGNVGCNPDDEESSHVAAAGLVIRAGVTGRVSPAAPDRGHQRHRYPQADPYSP